MPRPSGRSPSFLIVALAGSAVWACTASASRGSMAGVQNPAIGDTTEIIVAATTDVHGRLRGWDYFADSPDTLRGLSRAATLIDSVRQSRPGHVVLVDAGDLLQGNPLTYVAARLDSAAPHPVIAAMNAMQYDAAAIGNHEFNYGLPTLTRALEQSRFPFLAANAYRPNGDRAYGGSVIVERGGVRVAIVGATNPGSMLWDRDNLAGRLEIRDIVGDVAREVRTVRGRADAVVVVVHSGIGEPSSYDTVSSGVPSENVGARLAREVPGVDLIVIGHSHREVADTVINGVTIVQPRNWATSVSLTSLAFARRDGKWRITGKQGRLVRAAGHAEHPAILAATQRAHDATVRWVNQTLGTTPVAWRADSARVSDTPLIDFMLEVERRVAGTDLASTAAFDLGASLDAGPITVAEVARLYPYDNTLRAIRITGRQLRAYLEYSSRYYRTAGSPEATGGPVDPQVPGYNFDIVAGADYTLDISRPMGSRVTRLEVNGRPVTDGDSFTMALNNYRQTGGGGFAMLRDAPVIYDKQEEIRDLLIAEVRRRGTLRPEDFAKRNWSLEPAGAAAAAYKAMQGRSFDASGAVTSTANHLTSGRWLRIIATTDFHGAFEARVDANGVERGGAPYVAANIIRARRECAAPTCSSIWLDGGDQFQGTPSSNMAYGAPVVEMFSRLGLAVSALGNHEFDWGLDTLRARMRQAPYSFLAANVRDAAGVDIPWIPNDTLIEVEGHKIGVVGVATVETPTSTRPTNVSAMRFLPAAPVVDEHARSLRARGAEFVIVVAHAGALCDRANTDSCKGEIIDLATGVTEKIDAIVAGHSHTGVATIVKGIPIVEAFSRGSAVGVIDLPLAGGAPRVAIRNVIPDSIAADSATSALTGPIVARAERIFGSKVATIDQRMDPGSQSALGNLVADAHRVVAGGDVGIVNRGGMRSALRAGVATRVDVFEVEPFGNYLVRIRVRGSDLRDYLERAVFAREEGYFNISGVHVTYDRTKAPGGRIIRLDFADGRPWSARRTYSVIISDFLAVGGNGLGLPARPLSVEYLKLVDADALETYLRSLPQPVRAPTDARLIPVKP